MSIEPWRNASQDKHQLTKTLWLFFALNRDFYTENTVKLFTMKARHTWLNVYPLLWLSFASWRHFRGEIMRGTRCYEHIASYTMDNSTHTSLNLTWRLFHYAVTQRNTKADRRWARVWLWPIYPYVLYASCHSDNGGQFAAKPINNIV